MVEPRDTKSILEIARSANPAGALDNLAVLFGTVLDCLCEGIAILENGRIRLANSRLATMVGCEPSDLVGMSLKQVLIAAEPGETDPTNAVFSEIPSEALVLCKDGRRIHVETRLRTLPYRAGNLSVVSVADLTDLDLARHLVTRRGEYFRSIFEGVPDIVFIKDSDSKYVEVNPSLARLAGRPAEELVGLSARDLFGDAAAERIRQWDRRVLNGELIEEEHTVIVKGRPVTLHEVRVPLRNTKGQIIGICGIARNISERRLLTAQPTVSQSHYRSKAMIQTLRRAAQAAKGDGIVLLSGESGSGKDYVARWIHDHSARSGSPFFPLNCAALPQDLAESELFGHEAGAFTGATSRKRGLLELAEGGTLLLNEIGELILPLQSKLLTFLDTKSFLRVGGQKSVHVDARLMAASNRDLRSEVAAGRFLEPLYYRLNVLSIHVPPLRERREDIAILTREILEALSSEMHLSGAPVPGQSSVAALMNYDWPGNVRELRNVLERALMICEKDNFVVALAERDACAAPRELSIPFQAGAELRDLMRDACRAICLEILKIKGGNKSSAAKALGISRETLYRHLRDSETSSTGHMVRLEK
jgi:PAS domain S-box-containing protein